MIIEIKLQFLKKSRDSRTIQVRQEDMAEPDWFLSAVGKNITAKLTDEERQDLARVCTALGKYLK